MTREQMDALIAYIDAAIAEGIDDRSASDSGLVSYRQKREAEAKLRELLEEKEE